MCSNVVQLKRELETYRNTGSTTSIFNNLVHQCFSFPITNMRLGWKYSSQYNEMHKLMFTSTTVLYEYKYIYNNQFNSLHSIWRSRNCYTPLSIDLTTVCEDNNIKLIYKQLYSRHKYELFYQGPLGFSLKILLVICLSSLLGAQ